MLAKVKIQRKTSQMVKTKYGEKKKFNLLVLTEKGKEVWVGGFANPTVEMWNEGDTVEMEMEANGKYWNFRAPSIEIMIMKKLDRIEELLTKRSMPGLTRDEAEEDGPLHEEDEPEELPF